MKLSELMFIEDLNYEIEQGYVLERYHPIYNYRVLNYSAKTQYDNRWNSVTRKTRGLIVNDLDMVIFRPPEKFFNVGQPEAPVIGLDEQVTVMSKEDGSFIGVIDSPDGLLCATRGSFESDQAVAATKWLRERHPNLKLPTDTHSFYFEWVGPNNRIVLEYLEDQLVLLGATGLWTGKLYDARTARETAEWTGAIAEEFHFKNFGEALSYEFPDGVEGFVIKSGNRLAKLKSNRYLELHRLIWNLNDKRIWEQLREGMTETDIVKDLPDEFQTEVRRKIGVILDNHLELTSAVHAEYAKVYNIEDRKEFAIATQDFEHRSAMFLLKDSRLEKLKDYIWNHIEPRGEDSL